MIPLAALAHRRPLARFAMRRGSGREGADRSGRRQWNVARASTRGRWLVLAMFCSLLACHEPDLGPPLGPRLLAERLGRSLEVGKLGGVTKPILAESAERETTVSLSFLPASRVLLAAAQRNKRHARCSVRLEHPGGRSEVLSTLDLPAGASRWIEVEVQVPAVAEASLALSCLRGSERADAVWAQPIAIPLHVEGASPLVVLLSLDTLRADHVTGFGGPADLTPNLGKLGAEGLRLTATTSQGTWTLPSHWSLLHSAMWGFGFDAPRMIPPVTEPLARHGFVTVGLTGGGWVNPLSRGFDHYADNWVDDEPDLERVLAQANEWIDRLSDVPTFLFLHSYGVHQLRPEFRAWFQESGYEGGLFQPDADQLARDREFYVSLVRRVDAQLGAFLDRLRKISEERPVLLAIVSDHGEAFGEHGYHGHGEPVTLNDEVIRVPFVLWGPGIVPPGRTSDEPVMLTDIAPSILTGAGIPIPKTMQGRDLWPLWSDGVREESDPAWSLSHREGAWAFRRAAQKLIVRMSDASESDASEGSEEGGGQDQFLLFDLEQDPGETRDLASERPEAVAAIRAQLDGVLARYGLPNERTPLSPSGFPRAACGLGHRWRHCGEGALQPSRDPEIVDEETRRQLRALGYLD